jgi:hypothetical protein
MNIKGLGAITAITGLSVIITNIFLIHTSQLTVPAGVAFILGMVLSGASSQ